MISDVSVFVLMVFVVDMVIENLAVKESPLVFTTVNVQKE